MKRNRTIGVIVALVLVGVLLFSVARALHKKFTYKAPESIDDIREREGVPVTVAHPYVTDLATSFVLDGYVRPADRATPSAKVDEMVVRVHVEEGDKVKSGDSPTLLLEFDSAELQAARDAAKVACNDAKAHIKRVKALYHAGGASKQELQQASVSLAAAKSNLVKAETNLDRCSVHAPIDGVVSRRYVDVGEVTMSGDELLEIVDTSRLKVEMRVPERRVKDVRPGMRCRVVVGAVSESESVATSLALVSPELDPQTRELMAVCYLDPGAVRAVPGMFARVHVLQEERSGVIVVPDDIVLRREPIEGVYVVEEGAAKFRTIETGLRRDNLVEVTSGLGTNDLVVIDGYNQVSEGTKVLVSEGRSRET